MKNAGANMVQRFVVAGAVLLAGPNNLSSAPGGVAAGGVVGAGWSELLRAAVSCGKSLAGRHSSRGAASNISVMNVWSRLAHCTLSDSDIVLYCILRYSCSLLVGEPAGAGGLAGGGTGARVRRGRHARTATVTRVCGHAVAGRPPDPRGVTGVTALTQSGLEQPRLLTGGGALALPALPRPALLHYSLLVPLLVQIPSTDKTLTINISCIRLSGCNVCLAVSVLVVISVLLYLYWL